jgi:hypothetical protein
LFEESSIERDRFCELFDAAIRLSAEAAAPGFIDQGGNSRACHILHKLEAWLTQFKHNLCRLSIIDVGTRDPNLVKTADPLETLGFAQRIFA